MRKRQSDCGYREIRKKTIYQDIKTKQIEISASKKIWSVHTHATSTVISCVIAASNKSACSVFSFWVLCPAMQKLSLK